MKKFLLSLVLLLGFSAGAHAQSCSTYPFTLTNGTTADANQVMANFNHILACVNAASVPYTGPGDIVGSASAWWGFRGYQKAYTGKAANICLPSDTACQDMFIVNGNIVLTTIFGISCTNSTVCTVKTLYDQTLGNNCGGSCDLTNVSISNRPNVVVNCLGSLPCMSGGTLSTPLQSAGGLAVAQAFTISGVAERTGTTGSVTTYFKDTNTQIGFPGVVNQVLLQSNTALTATAVDSSFHAVQSIANGASSTIYSDGVATNGAAGTNALAGVVNAFGNFIGFITEIGVWPVGFNSTQYAAMNTNQHAYWGF